MKHGLQFIYVQSIIQLNQCVLRFDQVIKIVSVDRVKQDYSASFVHTVEEYLQSRDFNSSSLSLS